MLEGHVEEEEEAAFYIRVPSPAWLIMIGWNIQNAKLNTTNVVHKAIAKHAYMQAGLQGPLLNLGTKTRLEQVHIAHCPIGNLARGKSNFPQRDHC